MAARSPPIIETADYDAVIVGASLAGCADRDPARPRRAPGRPGREAARPTGLQAHLLALHPGLGVPAIERLGLLEPIEAAGGQRPRVHAWSRWGWVEAPPEQAAQGINLRREVLDPMVRSSRRRDSWRRADAGLERRAAAARERGVRRRRRPQPRRRGARAAGPADDRRRRSRLAHRRAQRGPGQDLPQCQVRLRRLLRGGCAGARARRVGLVPRPAMGGRLPHRHRSHLLRGDADQGAPARVQAGPRGRPGQVPRRHPRGAADPRRDAGSARCWARST